MSSVFTFFEVSMSTMPLEDWSEPFPLVLRLEPAAGGFLGTLTQF
jgi:hypothetical protein